jgi:hypothetical protein
LQLIWLPGHETAQVPRPQSCPLTHEVPGLPASPVPQPAVAPQYWLFEVGSTHVPLQLIWLPGHETAQAPRLQSCPLPHAVPALPASLVPQPAVAPQYWLFEVGSTHAALQLIWPPGQLTTQPPPLQAMPLPQTFSQAPQLAGSPCRFVQ